MEQLIDIRGIIIPDDWDEQNKITAIAISAVGEKEYLVKMTPKGKELLRHVRQKVVVKGYVHPKKETYKQPLLEVQEYQIIPWE